MMIVSNIISDTFFTELNKNIPSNGLISLHYDYNNEKLINRKNKLRFEINKNIKKRIYNASIRRYFGTEKN